MFVGIIGKKIGMTQLFIEDGEVVPVTVIQAGPCQILEVKDVGRHGYKALKLGFGEKYKNIKKPQKGFYDKYNLIPAEIVKEFRVDSVGLDEVEIGSLVLVGELKDVSYVDITGYTKGKGFAGVMKRHGFHGGPKRHGSRFHRAPGSIGACATPSRVMKGHPMPGHKGNERKTVQNLRVVKIDEDNHLLYVKGGVPGPNGGILYIKKAVKKG